MKKKIFLKRKHTRNRRFKEREYGVRDCINKKKWRMNSRGKQAKRELRMAGKMMGVGKGGR